MKFTQEQYDEAARAVILAVRARRATSNRRLHTDRYKKVAAKVLGITAVYPARWAQIIQAGHRLGLFGVDSDTLSKPFFIDHGGRPAPAPVAPAEDTGDEDTGDEDTESIAIKAPPRGDPRALDYCCQQCGTQARLHWAVRLPEDNADLYVDHDGRWKCHTCARLHFSESWGGVKQWRARR